MTVVDESETSRRRARTMPAPRARRSRAGSRPGRARGQDERAARFIEVRGLEKTFAGDGAPVHALRGLDLVVPEGTFLGVMGQSGSGKSTFLAMLGGLSHPSCGQPSPWTASTCTRSAARSSPTSAASTSASSSRASTWCRT